MSQITTHILDTSTGKPAEGVSIILEQKSADSWKKLAGGTTNTDGRIGDLLTPDTILKPGIYRMIFDTKPYFNTRQVKAFYPSITVEFEISDSSHYHVPLLLNPYGYSTYRGS